MFGTGIVAFNIATAVFSLYKTRPTGYLVTNKGTEEVFFAGELVVTIKDMCECVPRDAAILIATPEVYHSEIKDALVERGYSNLHLLNDQLEFMIMSAYFHKTGICKELQESEGDIAIPDLKLFMAKSVFDKPLQMVYHLPNYIYTVHAGAENSSIIDTDFSDNEGYSISSQNRNYCELSVTYWAWKNTQAQYKGICHYRRIFIMNESQIRTLSLDNVRSEERRVGKEC